MESGTESATTLFGIVVAAKRLAWSGLVKKLIAYIWSFAEGGEAVGMKQEKQCRIFKRCCVRTGAHPVTIERT